MFECFKLCDYVSKMMALETWGEDNENLVTAIESKRNLGGQ